MQQEIGLQGVTDGEFRRGSWHMDFLYQIGGVAKTDQTLRIQFRNGRGRSKPHSERFASAAGLASTRRSLPRISPI